ncbi:glycoside hydrolase [Lophiotrema nucula]|uniref:lytic cellulose monooxygenase (C4-dehydrogenating) n=1 Tax=Lophiotrema nucula TaxID=690887 RepID=A0A6A5Z8U6_9PLEO|nr:glycoside hydrolase [Lophiotrema nucula]
MVNNTMSPKWKYVRKSITNETAGLVGTGHFPPMYDLSSPDIRCGRNSTGSGPESDVAIVNAGSKVGFRLDYYPRGFCINCGQPQSMYFHDGALFAYLSRSPIQSNEGLQKWDGDGDFFKFTERGPDDDRGWFYNVVRDNWNVTIPKATPPGFYLLRVESLYPWNAFNKTQFYASCVQVEIRGPGGSSEPGPTVRFPGAFNNYDPGVLLPSDVSYGKWCNYKMPGPKVWRGEGDEGNGTTYCRPYVAASGPSIPVGP